MKELPMGIGKQAKVLTPEQIETALQYVRTRTRHPERNTVILLLSVKAGLRVCEISNLTWRMVCDANGQVGDTLSLPNIATKGKTGGRIIPLNSDLKNALIVLYNQRRAVKNADPDDHIIYSEQGSEKVSPNSLCVWFHRLYTDRLGFWGASSHSGRRTFITSAARLISNVGGSLRDVQLMAGHRNLDTTQRYIDGNRLAQATVVNMV
jgi:integrase